MKKTIGVILAVTMLFILSVCTAENRTDIEQSLLKIRNNEEKEYTLSTLEVGTLSTDAVDGAKYAAQLLDHVRFEQTDVSQWPDGEYVVLNFPKENLYYMFFYGNDTMVGQEKDGKNTLYRATPDQTGMSALKIMEQWVDAMAAVFPPRNEQSLDADTVGEFVDGSYYFRLKIREGDAGQWVADDLSQDNSVVRLGGTKMANDGVYEVRYDPVADGEMNVAVRHFVEGVCDEVHDFILRVKDGKITENVGGSYTASPDDSDLDPVLSGEWAEVNTQFTQMTVTRNEGRGWNVEIVSPLTHGAYVFKANIAYDCDLDGFVYSDGTFYNVPISDEENPDLGEPVAKDVSGIFHFEGAEGENDGEIRLSWYNSRQPDEQIVFERLQK